MTREASGVRISLKHDLNLYFTKGCTSGTLNLHLLSSKSKISPLYPPTAQQTGTNPTQISTTSLPPAPTSSPTLSLSFLLQMYPVGLAVMAG